MTIHWLIPRHAGASLAVAVLIGTAVLLAGCPSHSDTRSTAPPAATSALHGSLYGGRQPIVGATVVAYAVAPTAGAVPTELGTGVTDSSGHFTVSYPTPPASGQIIYAIASGGDAIGAGGGFTNPAIKLMTIVGIQDSALAPVATQVNIDELTTAATTAVLKDYVHFGACADINNNSQTGTCVSIPGASGLSRMAATVNNLVDVATGQPGDYLANNAQTAGAPLRATLTRLDTLANALAACVNASGSGATACTHLFRATGGPPDTLTSAWMIARMPAVDAKARALFQLAPEPPVFAPALATVPASTSAGFWTVGGERHAYTVNGGSDSLSAFQLAPAEGELYASVPGGPFNTGIEPNAVISDPTGRFVYAVNNCGNDSSCTSNGTISAYIVNDTGTLSLEGTVITEVAPTSLAADPSGRFVYAVNECGLSAGCSSVSTVSAYSIGPRGSLTYMSSQNAGSGALAVAVDPTGHYVYVTNSLDGTVSAYSIGSTGALTAIGTPTAVGSDPVCVTVDPTGRYAYVAEASADTVAAFSIGGSGTLSPVGTVNTGSSSEPNSIAVDPSGRYLYVTNFGAGSVAAYTIGDTGALSYIGTVSTGSGSGPTSVQVGPTGHYVHVVEKGAHTVATYKITSTGSLVSAGSGVSTGNGADSIAVDPRGRFVYVSNNSDNTVSAYGLDTGRLDTVNTVSAATGPVALAMDPRGRRIYAASDNANTIGIYRIDPDTGLSPIGSQGTGSGSTPYSVTIDPSGRYAYVADALTNSIAAYSIDPTGTLSVIGSVSTGSGSLPSVVKTDPQGRYVYVLNEGNNTVAAYTIGGTGALTALGSPVSTGQGPVGLVVDSQAHYVFVVNECGNDSSCSSNGSVSAYSIGSSGALTALGSPSTAGNQPVAMAVDPTGQYAYVTEYGDHTVASYGIGASGVLTPIDTASTDTHPYAVTVGPMDRYVYVTNQGSDSIYVYTIGTSGALTYIDQTPTGGNPYATVVGP